jgi:hypothetical protein
MEQRAARVRLSDEALLRQRWSDFVRRRPLVALAAAGAAGALLGGVFLSRLGRLLFVAAAGYMANEAWHREGRFDVRDVSERLSPR